MRSVTVVMAAAVASFALRAAPAWGQVARGADAWMARGEAFERALAPSATQAEERDALRCAALAYRRAGALATRPAERARAWHRVAYALHRLELPAEAALATRAAVCPALHRYEPVADLGASLACAGSSLAELRAEDPAALGARDAGPASEESSVDALRRSLPAVQEPASGPAPPLPVEACEPEPEPEDRARQQQGWLALGDFYAAGGHGLTTTARGLYALHAFEQAGRAFTADDRSRDAASGDYGRALLRAGQQAWSLGSPADASRWFVRLADHGASLRADRWHYERVAVGWLATVLYEAAWSVEPPPELLRCRDVVRRYAAPPADAAQSFECAGVARIEAIGRGAHEAVPNDRAWLPALYEALADLYAQQGYDYEAVAVYTMFVQRFPMDSRALRAARAVVAGYEHARALDAAAGARLRTADYLEAAAAANEPAPSVRAAYERFARDARIDAAVQRWSLARAARADAAAQRACARDSTACTARTTPRRGAARMAWLRAVTDAEQRARALTDEARALGGSVRARYAGDPAARGLADLAWE